MKNLNLLFLFYRYRSRFFSCFKIDTRFCLSSKIVFKRSTETNEIIMPLYVSAAEKTRARNFCEYINAAVIVPTVFSPFKTVNPIIIKIEILIVKLVKKLAVEDCILIIVDFFTCTKIMLRIFLNF